MGSMKRSRWSAYNSNNLSALLQDNHHTLIYSRNDLRVLPISSCGLSKTYLFVQLSFNQINNFSAPSRTFLGKACNYFFKPLMCNSEQYNDCYYSLVPPSRFMLSCQQLYPLLLLCHQCKCQNGEKDK